MSTKNECQQKNTSLADTNNFLEPFTIQQILTIFKHMTFIN